MKANITLKSAKAMASAMLSKALVNMEYTDSETGIKVAICKDEDGQFMTIDGGTAKRPHVMKVYDITIGANYYHIHEDGAIAIIASLITCPPCLAVAKEKPQTEPEAVAPVEAEPETKDLETRLQESEEDITAHRLALSFVKIADDYPGLIHETKGISIRKVFRKIGSGRPDQPNYIIETASGKVRKYSAPAAIDEIKRLLAEIEPETIDEEPAEVAQDAQPQAQPEAPAEATETAQTERKEAKTGKTPAEVLRTAKRIDRGTFKRFVNAGPKSELQIKTLAEFDGMTDGIETVQDEFKPVHYTAPDNMANHNLGIDGVWLVDRSQGRGSDSFELYEDSERIGIRVSNCCGRFILAVLKAPQGAQEAPRETEEEAIDIFTPEEWERLTEGLKLDDLKAENFQSDEELLIEPAEGWADSGLTEDENGKIEPEEETPKEAPREAQTSETVKDTSERLNEPQRAQDEATGGIPERPSRVITIKGLSQTMKEAIKRQNLILAHILQREKRSPLAS